ncbi:hypothetical protein Amsp01_091000 [Amycolatopsis sp. NBRC 101858]|uniref:hypothetical protein n=1 Tax=Amycolatopsis sp. NBRC 101858 TaxID=3032200 RepID=UPI0024A25C23|nr:hypothetical protein [Amycolatopsis sp. NBRC 101858]GLY43077.1 hypothetical protein Amsp01_091000 [Amycolatopsis sp. NBRC 101858]
MGQGDAPVGRSVKTAAAGVRDLAAEAARVGAAAAARAVEITDRKLTEGADELAKVGRSASKDFDKSTRSSRRDVRKHSVAARDEVLSRAVKLRDPGRKAAQAIATVAGSANDSNRKRRKAVATAKRDLAVALEEAKSVARGERTRRARWPWVLAFGAVAAAIVAVVQVKRSNPLVEEDKAPVPADKVVTPADQAVPPTPAKPVAAAPEPADAPKPPAKPAAAAPKPAEAPKPANGANGHAAAGKGKTENKAR